ncbi:MAG: hypothetical protein IPP40_04550 [bacterium]|nr:hypothetical protein [bacterium]
MFKRRAINVTQAANTMVSLRHVSCHLADYNNTDEPDHQAAGFSNQCQTCHTTNNWDANYNHNNTGFPLTGRHVQATCIQCHASGQYDGLPTTCASCHLSDYNGTNDPDHEAANFPTTCQTCHSTSNWNSTFNHNNTSFPLTGQHIQATCNQCHASGQYDGLPTTCVSCHLADYNGTTDPDHEAANFPTTCQTCHTTSNWDANFNHNNSSFPLTGQHVQATCNQCHASGQYDGLPTTCVSCHLADYNDTDDPDHQAAGFSTQCQTCHTTSNWDANFNHNNTGFPLTGQHITATCNQCHSGGIYNGLTTVCVDCHLADYNSSADPDHEADQYPTACQDCHTPSNWNSTFNHAPLFPITTGAHRNEWNTCRECHPNAGNFGVFSCTHCHEHRQSEANSEHQDVNGYQWLSSACYSCHPDGREGPNPAPRQEFPR